jgi:choline dehydrogenase
LGLLGTPIDWQYDTIPNNVSCLAYRDQQCRFSRGRCLGGTTSINAMIYARGTPNDFDDLGIPGWTWNDIKPYFLRFEGLKDLDKLPNESIPYHNTTGPMSLEFFTDSENPWHSRIISGYEDLDIPFNPDVNAKSIIGVTEVIGYVYNNERMSTARGYLGKIDVQERLKIAKNTICTKVIIGANNIAKGITVVHGVFQKRLRLYANKEVILSAGALATPQILMLSGIGRADHLKEFNIPIRSDLPVGDNMTDHVLPLLFVKVTEDDSTAKELVTLAQKAVDVAELLLLKEGPLCSNGLTDINVFLNTKCYNFQNRRLENNDAKCEIPTSQLIHAYIDKGLIELTGTRFQRGTDLNTDVVNQLKIVNRKYAFIVKSPLVLQPHSSGNVRLRSRDPLAPPAIFPNYLSDERDLEEMLRTIAILEQLLETEPYRRYNASIVKLDLKGCPPFGEDKYWECYCRQMTQTTYHAVGTTAVGRVVDRYLRVLGVRRLRVADLGVLPRVPRGNTAAAAIAIGERVADFILSNQ